MIFEAARDAARRATHAVNSISAVMGCRSVWRSLHAALRLVRRVHDDEEEEDKEEEEEEEEEEDVRLLSFWFNCTAPLMK